MFFRSKHQDVLSALEHMPIVALLGPRQVGKTTLSLAVLPALKKAAIYLDLELEADLRKLDDAAYFLAQFKDKLVVIDEVQRKPDLFTTLRSMVDQRKQSGERTGHFLLLGSASKTIVQASSESLAGRIRYIELTPFHALELANNEASAYHIDKHWFRGGFPDSYCAENDLESWNWRSDFVQTYLEKDIPSMGFGIAATQLRRFWTMLAHFHGQQIVLSALARSLDISHTSVRTYLDLLTDFYMVRQLKPWSGNLKKRLVKSPKIYIRDTGILHRLLQLSSFEVLQGHPSLGSSWEGFVVEQILSVLDDRWDYSYYRTATQVELDLVLQTPKGETWAIEIKRSATPKLSRGFYESCQDVGAVRSFVLCVGVEHQVLSRNVELIGLLDLCKLLKTY
jgi:predicted AAA+ superfamily ATPase